MKSVKLLNHLQRLRNSGRESNPALLEKQGLQADVKLAFVNAKLAELHPVIRLDDYFQMLAKEDRLEVLSGGHDLCTAIDSFWSRYSKEDPAMVEKIKAEKGPCSYCLPMAVYGDEGLSHKKSQFLVFGTQPVIGFGTAFTQHATDLGVNMMGHSSVTRILYTVMRANMYNRSPEVFEAILEGFSDHCLQLYNDGVEVWHSRYETMVTLYPTFVFAKGDWPWLKKVGFLIRSHHQSIAAPSKSLGICHLCLAGTAEFPDWSNIVDGAWLHDDSLLRPAPPWRRESPLTTKLCKCVDICGRSWWYRPDLFHTLHKGVLAELAGSGLVS